MKPVFFFLSAAVVVVGWSGCATVPPPPAAVAPAPAPADTAAVTSPDTFVALDPTAAKGVAVAAQLSHLRPDGRLEVLASLKNATAQPLRISVGCFFKSKAGAVTGEPLVWHPLALAAGATETVDFIATDARAERYTLAARATK